MSELYFMVTITDRNMSRTYLSLYAQHGVSVTYRTVGHGTAANEILDYFGLERAEKTVIFSIVTGQTWRTIKKALQSQLKIDIPGTGIAFLVPLSSIGGKKPLQYLTEHQHFEIGEESVLKDTKYELLVVIANQGYSNLIMDAAREADAGGGTVIHAQGTGAQRAEVFLGVSLVNEKEIVFIVVKRENKNRVMRAIMDKAGLESKARSILFSLPVTSTAGMRLLEEEPEENASEQAN